MRVPRLAPSPALVIACLALVVASAQPVASAVSALVPTNSVGTAQLKDGAVTTPKLRDGAVKSPKIANGTVGLLDLATAARPKPPKVRAVSGSMVDLPTNGSLVKIAELDLPAGSWVLIGKAVASTGSGTNNVTCHLYKGEFSLDFSTAHSQVFSELAQMYIHAIPLTAVTSGAGHVELRCNKSNNAAPAFITAGSKLIAIQVTP